MRTVLNLSELYAGLRRGAGGSTIRHVSEAIDADGGSHDALLEQLVPLVEVVARAERHGAVTLVLERELDL